MLSALLLFAVVAADPVWMPGAAEKDRFMLYFNQGELLYTKGEYGPAIWNFKRAERQLTNPAVSYDLAKCHEKLSDTAFTTYYYRLYLRQAPTATDALDVAEKVGSALSHAESNGRGLLEIEVPGAVKITVANREFPEGPVAIFLPPGDYEVKGTFPEGVKKVIAQLRTGKTTTLVFEPMSPPLLEARQGAPDDAVATATYTGVRPSKMRIASFVVAGLGVGALAVGTVMGVLSSKEAGQLKPDGTLTYSQGVALASSANTKGVAANVLWSAGGAAVAGGVLMFVFSMPEPGMKNQGGK